MIDIAASNAFCNEEDSTTRYMISICVSFNHLKDDPRCPVRIGNDERKQYYIISSISVLPSCRSAPVPRSLPELPL